MTTEAQLNRPAWAATITGIPVLAIVLAVTVSEVLVSHLAGAAPARLGSPLGPSLVILLTAGPLEEVARWTVGAAAADAGGLRAAQRRLWCFFACCVLIEAAGAAVSVARHPPGGPLLMVLSLMLLRLPPSLAHAAWTWLTLRSVTARNAGRAAASAGWFGVAFATHLAWDSATAGLALLHAR